MNISYYFKKLITTPLKTLLSIDYIKYFLTGAVYTLGFSPFNYSVFTLISLALLYGYLLRLSLKQSIKAGFFYGVGLFSMGVSWVIISIHDYGQLNYFISFLITLLFIVYLSCFPVLSSILFKWLEIKSSPLLSSFLFSTTWIIGEYVRATLFTGFPWLLAGTSQTVTPLKYLAPIIGIYGLGFIVCLSAAFFTNSFRNIGPKRFAFLIAFVLIIISPTFLKNLHWTKLSTKPVRLAVIQSNLSMRDKWDETLFWNIIKHYQESTYKYLDKDLIVMPESAIPLPITYVKNILNNIHEKAQEAKTSVMLGILQESNTSSEYYNSLLALGNGQGKYAKRHLVPFGEYIPQSVKFITRWLMLPPPGLKPGAIHQPLIQINGIPVASLICYEIAYPTLLRQQMPQAHWIISISDNGWFGHSFASYQQLQMAQMLSLQTGRYQVLANNDGLSSVINPSGDIEDHLPAFQPGILESKLFSATGTTPWIIWGDSPLLFFCLIILIFALLLKFKRKP